METQYIRMKEVIKVMGMAKPTIYRRIAEGDFPKPTKVGRNSLWHVPTLMEWVNDQEEAKYLEEYGHIVQ